MILLNVLNHDLKRSKGSHKVAHLYEVPVDVSSLPALVSGPRGQFIQAKHPTRLTFTDGGIKISKDDRPEPSLVTATFNHDPDRMDEILGPLVMAAYELSVGSKFPNRFNSPSLGFDYVKEHSHPHLIQPHVCLVPSSWKEKDVRSRFDADLKFSGKKGDSVKCKYREYCRVIPAPVHLPVFMSKPETMGLYTQFMGGTSSVALYNIAKGMAFLDP